VVRQHVKNLLTKNKSENLSENTKNIEEGDQMDSRRSSCTNINVFDQILNKQNNLNKTKNRSPASNFLYKF